MYTVDLHLKNETVEHAKYNLIQAIQLSRKTKEKVLCLIVGYGSTGGSHKIKTAILDELESLLIKHQIKDYILGTDIDIFNVKYQNFKGKEFLDKECFLHKNPGEIIVVL
ncbi:MAG: hypothetical protein K2I42_01005 [Anaeroplasmataceae bacterium]|nr:hypothetical protein [Anaeroplasmataceae bacterium]